MAIKAKLEKNSEFTYGVHAGHLAELVQDNQATILDVQATTVIMDKLDGGMMGAVRSLTTKFELMRQAIAYTLPVKFAGDGSVMFLVYQRNKTNNEGQLSRKLSLAPGGHVEHEDAKPHFLRDDDGDLVGTGALSLVDTLEANLLRELAEEVTFYTNEDIPTELGRGNKSVVSARVIAERAEPIGFVMDSGEKGYVGNIHFGVIYLAPVMAKDASFRMNEPQNDAMGWATAVQLLEHIKGESTIAEGVPFEPWSRMIIEQIADVVGLANHMYK